MSKTATATRTESPEKAKSAAPAAPATDQVARKNIDLA